MVRVHRFILVLALFFAVAIASDARASGTAAGDVRNPTGTVLSSAGIDMRLDCRCRDRCPTDRHCRCCPDALKAISDRNGRFSITAPAGSYTLTATLAGYQPTVLKVTVREGRTTIVSVTLRPTKPAGR